MAEHSETTERTDSARRLTSAGESQTDARPAYSRRVTLRTYAIAATVGLAGCVGRIPGMKSSLQNQLDTAREATTEYEDPKQALEDGFQVFGPYVPGMGWHFLHPERGEAAAENELDIEKPNLLTYVDGDDGLELGAVEWGVPVDAVSENPDLFADDDGSETWHVHEAAAHVFALPDDEQTKPPDVPFSEWVTNDNWAEFHPPDHDLEAGDTIALNWGTVEGKEGDRTERIVDAVATHPDLNTLHAWIHTENPEGVFNPVNPKFGGDHSH